MAFHSTDSFTHLSSKQREVLFEKGTEAPFSGTLLHNKENGVYMCAACGQELFSSDTKFDSNSGWPSFFDVVDKSHIIEKVDFSAGVRRIEVSCKQCGGHLGHVFPDGPSPTRMRYCINSLSLSFKPTADAALHSSNEIKSANNSAGKQE